MAKKMKRLVRGKNRMIVGVCDGIADYFGIDATLVRLAWIVATFMSMGVGIIGYLVAAIVIPNE